MFEGYVTRKFWWLSDLENNGKKTVAVMKGKDGNQCPLSFQAEVAQVLHCGLPSLGAKGCPLPSSQEERK